MGIDGRIQIHSNLSICDIFSVLRVNPRSAGNKYGYVRMRLRSIRIRIQFVLRINKNTVPSETVYCMLVYTRPHDLVYFHITLREPYTMSPPLN